MACKILKAVFIWAYKVISVTPGLPAAQVGEILRDITSCILNGICVLS